MQVLGAGYGLTCSLHLFVNEIHQLLLVFVEALQVLVKAVKLPGHLFIDVILLTYILDFVADGPELFFELAVFALVVAHLR